MKIGAHLSIAGGYIPPLEKISAMGGNCLQIFSSSPRNWGVVPVPDDDIQTFLMKRTELNVDPIYFHASYLINLANPGPGGHLSVKTLIDELRLAEKMHVKGTIIHLGSFNGEGYSYDALIKNIVKVLEHAPSTPYFIIENAGNNKIGKNITEIAQIIADLKSPNVRVCIDTCHLFAAGYDLSTREKFHAFFTEFDEIIGIDRLEVIQVNDSKDPLGSGRDRHENLGVGLIPSETFRLYVNETVTKNLPFLLEVPGFDKDKKGPDKKNLDIFKSYLLI